MFTKLMSSVPVHLVVAGRFDDPEFSVACTVAKVRRWLPRNGAKERRRGGHIDAAVARAAAQELCEAYRTATCDVRGMVETEWDTFLRETRKVRGGGGDRARVSRVAGRRARGAAAGRRCARAQALAAGVLQRKALHRELGGTAGVGGAGVRVQQASQLADPPTPRKRGDARVDGQHGARVRVYGPGRGGRAGGPGGVRALHRHLPAHERELPRAVQRHARHRSERHQAALQGLAGPPGGARGLGARRRCVGMRRYPARGGAHRRLQTS